MAGHSNSLISIRLVEGLPLVSVEISVNGHSTRIENVLIDTGSAGTIFSADRMLELNIKPSIKDALLVISGVGGNEYAYSKTVDSLRLGHISLNNFEIEVGAMDYGFGIEGILGLSFLLPIKAKIDFETFSVAGHW